MFYHRCHRCVVNHVHSIPGEWKNDFCKTCTDVETSQYDSNVYVSLAPLESQICLGTAYKGVVPGTCGSSCVFSNHDYYDRSLHRPYMGASH